MFDRTLTLNTWKTSHPNHPQLFFGTSMRGTRPRFLQANREELAMLRKADRGDAEDALNICSKDSKDRWAASKISTKNIGLLLIKPSSIGVHCAGFSSMFEIVWEDLKCPIAVVGSWDGLWHSVCHIRLGFYSLVERGSANNPLLEQL